MTKILKKSKKIRKIKIMKTLILVILEISKTKKVNHRNLINLKKILKKFVETKSSAGVITFNSIHPRWSYVTTDKNNNVLQAFEKKVKSRSAIAGFYYFKNAEIFFNAGQKTILNDASVNGNFFISSSLNEVILQGGKILSIEIPESTYHSFYMPSKIENYLQ